MFYPIQPCPEASAECLARRVEEVETILQRRRFSEFAASEASMAVIRVCNPILRDGTAQNMAPGQRAALVWKVALRAAIRASRRELRMLHLSVDVPAPNQCEDCEWLLSALTPTQYQAVKLHVISGLSLGQSAEIMQMGRSSVAHHCKQGIETLRHLCRFSARVRLLIGEDKLKLEERTP